MNGFTPQFLYRYLCGMRYESRTALSIGWKSGTSNTTLLNKTKALITWGWGWSNREVVIFEEKMPKASSKIEVTRLPKNASILWQFESIRSQDVSLNFTSVGAQTIVPREKHYVIEFTDGENTAWFDSQYLTALLKRCDREKPIEYYFIDMTLYCKTLAICQDQVIGLIMSIEVKTIGGSEIIIRYREEK